MSFQIGDSAVYPGFGVGKIINIETQMVGGRSCEFYVVELKAKDSKVLVPKDSKDRLRPIVTVLEAQDVLMILESEILVNDQQAWNRRFRDHTDKIRFGNIKDIAEVLRQLFLLRMEKELSYGERKMLEHARNIVGSELAIALANEVMVSSRAKEVLGWQ